MVRYYEYITRHTRARAPPNAGRDPVLTRLLGLIRFSFGAISIHSTISLCEPSRIKFINVSRSAQFPITRRDDEAAIAFCQSLAALLAHTWRTDAIHAICHPILPALHRHHLCAHALRVGSHHSTESPCRRPGRVLAASHVGLHRWVKQVALVHCVCQRSGRMTLAFLEATHGIDPGAGRK
jgi:hypothetical protein